MSGADPTDHRLDHLVVVMFENRSFDNLLGYLYTNAENLTFEGVGRRPLSNPAPGEALGGNLAPLAVHPATSMAVPYPDPGEEYPHVNTQIFGRVDPESNRFAPIEAMQEPFNAPAPGTAPTMDGFVRDYVNNFRESMGRLPRVEEYAQIMASYTPAQVPVLSALARGFTCFDHWYCEVPSQTYPNRSFFHAGTSSGFVLNGHPPGKFALQNAATTIFNRLEEAGRSWRVYIDPLQILPATGLIHARVLEPFFATNFRTIFDFYHDAEVGELPNYAFVEPNMFHPHTDMHPHSGARWAEDLGLKPPDTLLGGEKLLADVYGAVRRSESPTGSRWDNTALLVTFDEHGGTFDHVPPPPAEPPDDSVGEEGFRFDRLGVRVPTVLVSAWADEGHVVGAPFRSTSAIRTLIEWWGLGAPLTRRDADAPSLLPLLSRGAPRPATDWPDVQPRGSGLRERAEQEFLRRFEDLIAPMDRLERDLLGDALAHEARVNHTVPVADSLRATHQEAHDHFQRIGANYFPGIANGRRS
jgi:phospholipase C